MTDLAIERLSTKMKVLIVLCACVALISANKPARRLGGRIVGGEEADIEDHPFQVVVLKYGDLLCGGAIIGNDWVIR